LVEKVGGPPFTIVNEGKINPVNYLLANGASIFE
jgi:hypothetical protein